jgi:hypothetical protein
MVLFGDFLILYSVLTLRHLDGMPVVRLIIFIFRGIGGFFRAIGRMFRALFSAGMFAFLARSFDALLRLGFIGSLFAAGAVCWKQYAERPFVSAEYARLAMPSAFRVSSYNNYSYDKATLEAMLTRFIPKDSKIVYGAGKLDAETFIQVWNDNEMVHVTGQAVDWQYNDRTPSLAGPKPMLKPEDFSPSRWSELTDFFQATWAILTLPLVVALLVFPGGARLRDRIFRACLLAPACVVTSFSFAYLLSLQWLSVQHAVYAEMVLDLPRWVQPTGLLNMSLVAGFSFSLMPVALWYLVGWVLGPFFKPSAVPPTP